MEGSLPVILANAKSVKNIPGRKTDVSDAAWLAQLGAHGMVRPSFVPAEPIRDLRDMTRARAATVQDRTRVIHRLEKFLESSGIKLSSVVARLLGVSSRAMLDALVAGERDPEVLASLAKGRLKAKAPQLVEALNGRFRDHHAKMTRMYLDEIDTFTRIIDDLTRNIEEVVEPFRLTREILTTIPGVSELVADVIIAETGADMSAFTTAAHLASWAGVCPGSNESAGRVKSARTRPGNHYLKAALGTAALADTHSTNTYLAAKYRRITARSGRMKALVALEHSILTAVWNMLTNGECYTDPGADYFIRLNPTKEKNKAIRQLEKLGYDVTVTPATQASAA
jgi:transposase